MGMSILGTVNNEGPIRLMEIAMAISVVEEKIPQETFLQMCKKDRIAALKKHFERLMIKSKNVVDNYVPVIDAESKSLNEEVKKTSAMVEKSVNNGMGFGPSTVKCFLHNDSNPSMTWAPEKHGFHCLAGCMDAADGTGRIFDLFNYLAWRHGFKGYTKFKDAFEMAVHLFVEGGENIENPYDVSKQKEHSHFISYTPMMNRVRHYSFHHPLATEGLEICVEKLVERGISMATANKHSVMLWMHQTKEKKFLGAIYYVFLNDNGSYTRRLAAVDSNTRAMLNMHPEPAKWLNPKSSKVPMGVFNERILNHCRQWDELCFVTESAMDALSVEELGFHSVGTNSVKNVQRFLKEHVDADADIKLICLLDNDEPGKNIARLFKSRNLFVPDYLELDYDGDRWLSKHKDINEALVADRDKTLSELQALEQEADDYYTSLGDNDNE